MATLDLPPFSLDLEFGTNRQNFLGRMKLANI
jgi:hypothetical protein